MPGSHRRSFLLLIAGCGAVGLLSFGSLSAQSTPTPTPATGPRSNAQRFWRAELPGGTYLVALDRIQSLSLHEYSIPPLTRVTEMTVETNGPVVARFYYLETETPQAPLGIGQSAIDLLKEKTEEVATTVAGSDPPWEKVVKTYPATTHAHTVEYRLGSKEDLQKLFDHAQKCWTTGRGDEIKLDQ